MEIVLSREQLTTVIKKQLERYNMQHPKEKMDAEELFQKAEHFYYRKKHPDRYTILWKWLEPELQEEPCFITKLRNTYKRKTSPRKISKNPEDDFCIPHDKEEIEKCMNGQCLLFDEWWADDCVKPMGEPSKLFYMLARASEMSETDLIRAFYEGEILDVLQYDSFYVYDIFEYYFEKSGLTVTELSEKITLRGYKSSTIAKLLNRSESITYEQFIVLAEALEIPKKWTDLCRYRLTQTKDRLPYRIGYKSWENIFMENADETVTSFHSLEDISRSKKWGTISKLYRQMGYSLLSDDFPEQVDAKDHDAMSKKHMVIMSPDFSKHSPSLKEYETVIKKVLAFAHTLMDSRLE